MKFKFKPQTAVLIGGMLAAAYAEACYYSNTTAICFVSGNQVDTIPWPDGTSTANVYATGDFTANAPLDTRWRTQGLAQGATH
ncbi:MAG TPA: hypothetical protein VG146_04510 [Verrucomicrobiae bacterium]|nr:hypothetical protein [Verrucomicrobiae bacterium]